jgi:glycine betaine/proline transport system ATP-binding protein
MNAALEFKNVDILFCKPGGNARKQQRAALAALDAGGSRSEIQERLGVVIGVAGASLTVPRGEICVLMGLSGSGKSTLLRAANGLNPATRGEVWVRDGEAMTDIANCGVAKMRHLRRARVAMVFQQFGLLPWRSVRANVGFGLELRGESAATSRRMVDEKLELVGLTQWADRSVGELSGGMQQRVGLARAFATDAEILLMDEPFSALDPLIRGKLQDELLELQARVKKTMLFVSHDMDEALRLGDQISILQNGRIIQTGSADDIVLTPCNDYVAEFVRHMNPLSVLEGNMIMRTCGEMERDGATHWLDATRRYRLSLDDGQRSPTVRLDELEQVLHHIVDDATVVPPHSMAVAPAAYSLRSLIALRQLTGHPVLLAQDDRIVGVCGDSEIIRALAGNRQNSLG